MARALHLGATPQRPQFQTTECGIGVLRTVLAHFGREVSARDLRRITGVSRDCLSAIEMKRAAQAFGLRCRASRVEPDALMGMRLPIIVHLNFIHFAVLEAIDLFRVRLNCPNAGIQEMPRADFDLRFTGIALSLTPGPEFHRPAPAGSGEGRWWLNVVKPAVASVVAGLALRAAGACILVRLAFLMSDAGVTAVVGTGAVAAAAALHAFVPRFFLAGEERAYSVIRERMSERLLTVPNTFYAYRLPHALFLLFGGARGAAAALTDRVAPAIGASVDCTVLLGGATALDPGLGLAFTVILAAWTAAASLLCVRGREVDRFAPNTLAERADHAVDALVRPASVRLGVAAHLFRTSTLGRLAAQCHVENRTGWNAELLSALPLALGLALLSAVAIRGGHGTGEGAALALLACALAWAAAPSTQLRGVIGDIRRAGSRIADVLDEPAEEVEPAGGEPSRGRVEILGVSFRYNPHGPLLLDDVSMRIEPGEQLGLSGPSGGGKTSLVEILLGLHRPERGAVLIDGIEVGCISPLRLARLVLRVDRAPVVVEGTLRDNLLLGDRDISEADLGAAIADAALGDVVARRPGGLDAPIEAFGWNLSGGQLRRLEIARALARNPRVLVLDDAVDDLDLRTERAIRANLRRRGCSLLLVTHRAASLALCDRVVRWRAPTTPPAASPFAGALGRGVPGSAPMPPADGVDEALDRVARSPATPTGTPPPGDRAGPRSIVEAARLRGLAVRPVRLRQADWTGAAGDPVLAFRRDGSPEVFRAWPDSHDPLPGGPSADRAELLPTGYEVVSACPPPPRSSAAWSRAVLAGQGTAILALAGAGLVEALSLGAFPLLVVAPWRGTAPIAAGLLLAAAISLAIWRSDEGRRVSVGIRRAHHEGWVALCLSTAGGLGRALRPADLFGAVEGLSAGAETARAVALRAPAAAFRAAGALAGMALLGGAAAFALGLAAASARLAAATGEALTLRGREHEIAMAERRSRQHLAAVVFGMLRLRGLCADRPMMDAWRELDDGARAAKRRTDALKALSNAGRHASGIGLLVALASIAPTPSAAAGSAMLGWILLHGVDGLGAIARASVIGRGKRALACRLLAWPREAGSRDTAAWPATLSLRGVAYRYPGSPDPVLSGLDIDVDLDAVTVITGPSGGGKSTALDLLLGFLRPDEGQAALDGTPFVQADLARWRRGVAGVFQTDRLGSASTISAHLWVDAESTLSDLWAALDLVDLADEVAAMPMGIQTIVEAGTLSAGQQQRLLIARALVQKPRLLVLDEATNAIPDDIQARLLGRLRARQIGCLAVSHRETMIMVADTVHVVDNTCLFSGAPAEMRRHPAAMAVIEDIQTR